MQNPKLLKILDEIQGNEAFAVAQLFNELGNIFEEKSKKYEIQKNGHYLDDHDYKPNRNRDVLVMLEIFKGKTLSEARNRLCREGFEPLEVDKMWKWLKPVVERDKREIRKKEIFRLKMIGLDNGQIAHNVGLKGTSTVEKALFKRAK